LFCPNCGRDNARERKFCAGCGTNLEAVSQALSGSADDFLTKTDAGLDLFIARYAEHVFKDAPSKATDRTIAGSWRILGQGVLTSFVDLFLFWLMWNMLPLRFLILLISTPVRLLSRRGNRQRTSTGELEAQIPPALAERDTNRFLPGQAPSVTEHTTDTLQNYQRPQPEDAVKRR